jgi:hypothetical protein
LALSVLLAGFGLSSIDANANASADSGLATTAASVTGAAMASTSQAPAFSAYATGIRQQQYRIAVVASGDDDRGNRSCGPFRHHASRNRYAKRGAGCANAQPTSAPASAA